MFSLVAATQTFKKLINLSTPCQCLHISHLSEQILENFPNSCFISSHLLEKVSYENFLSRSYLNSFYGIWKSIKLIYVSDSQKTSHFLIAFTSTLEFSIDGTPRLLIIPFFAILPNLTQYSPLINFGEFCQPPLLF